MFTLDSQKDLHFKWYRPLCHLSWQWEYVGEEIEAGRPFTTRKQTLKESLSFTKFISIWKGVVHSSELMV